MERDQALEMAVSQIERQFGKGSIMKLGEQGARRRSTPIPTGALALDLALGIGGLPRGRIVEIFGPESSGKSTLATHVVAEAQRNGGVCARTSTPSTRWTRSTPRRIGVNVDELLISQPDTGEQALEIADMLDPLGRARRARHRLGGGARAARRDRRRDGRLARRPAGPADEPGAAQAHRQPQQSRTICIFINQLREKIGVMFGSPGDHAGRPGAEVLLVGAARHPPHRDDQGRRRGGRQPRAREGRQEQGRAAVQAGRVRHHVRRGHLAGRARCSTSPSITGSSRSRARSSPTTTSGSARAART